MVTSGRDRLLHPTVSDANTHETPSGEAVTVRVVGDRHGVAASFSEMVSAQAGRQVRLDIFPVEWVVTGPDYNGVAQEACNAIGEVITRSGMTYRGFGPILNRRISRHA